jgi:hypothetical protein
MPMRGNTPKKRLVMPRSAGIVPGGRASRSPEGRGGGGGFRQVGQRHGQLGTRGPNMRA